MRSDGAATVAGTQSLLKRLRITVSRMIEPMKADPRAGFALLLLWLFLMSPLLIEPFIADPRSHPGKYYYPFNLVTTVLWFGALHFSVRRPIALHLFLLPLYLTTASDLFVMSAFGTRLSSTHFTILMTDYNLTVDFLMTYWPRVAFFVALVGIVYALGLYGIRKLRLEISPTLVGLFMTGLVCFYVTAVGRGARHGNTYKDAAFYDMANEMSAPVGALFRAAIAINIRENNSTLTSERKGFGFHARKSPSPRKEIYVFVVGESSRPQNWALFGYSRNTTPRLLSTTGVIALPHVMTTGPLTYIAVPSMLSLEPITKWSLVVSRKSIVEAFNEAGFKTYWLSTQPVDSFGGIIPVVAAEAGYRAYFDPIVDGALLPPFRRIVEQSGPTAKIFVVLHTMGSHFEYARRYPREFDRFRSTNSSRRDNLIDSYDNSVLYTDAVVSEVIAVLAAQDCDAALIFASDHGENLLDDTQQLLGHGIGNRYDLSTAAFIWLSDRFRLEFPRKIDNVTIHASAPISLSNLSHSLLDIAEIEADGYDETMDLFSEEFATHSRSYFNQGAPQLEQISERIAQ